MKLRGSLSFRLALTYAALFGASVTLLGGLYYWLAIESPLRAVRAELRTEGQQYLALRGQYGEDALASRLERRAGAPAPRIAYHALLRPDGSAVTTNLPSWPRAFAAPWLLIEADVSREGDEDEYEALVLDQRLGDGGRLLLGRDIEDLDELEEGLTDTLVWLIPALALLGILGGALMSLAIGRRLEAVTTAARRVIAGDLSERIPVRGSGDDFDQLNETLNLMLARIEESLEAVRRVSDSVAHELRTPLARLQASLLELRRDGDPEGSLLAEMAGEAERLQTIFESVLRISRIEASLPRDSELVDFSLLLLDAAELYQPAAESRGQVLSVDVETGLMTRGDRNLLFQAVSNLIDNAIKYAPTGGAIAVRAAGEKECLILTVSDNGPGIPPELREKVTERFFRAPGTDGIPGLGLGLAFVSAVAAFHESSVRFESSEPGLRVEWRLLRPE